MKRLSVAAAAAGLALSSVVLASPAGAATGPSCSDAYQVGSTGYITVDGATAGSVKQYYSPKCNRNYGYVFVWQSFRNAHAHWFASAGVYVPSEQYVYASEGSQDRTEVWSGPANTVSKCTQAYGFIDVTKADGTSSSGTHQGTGTSSKRC